MKQSVLVPVYNVEEYLEACIASVLNQTYHDYELILVDDGSTDSSPEICDRYASWYPEKIKTIHKKNEGCLIARRRAVMEASGEILVFLDADDCLRKDALMRIHEAFCRHACDMVMFNYGSDPDFSAASSTAPFPDGACMGGEGKITLYKKLCDTSALNSLCMKAVKKEIADRLPDYTEFSHVTNGEDLLCTLPLVTFAEKIVHLDQCLYFYRQRPGSAVRTLRLGRCGSIKTVHQEFERYIDIWNLPELHPGHYAREVRGWVEMVMLLACSRKTIGPDQFDAQMHSMAEDSYFRNAYVKMDGGKLNREQAVIAKCLYEKKIRKLVLICNMVRIGTSIRRKAGLLLGRL